MSGTLRGRAGAAVDVVALTGRGRDLDEAAMVAARAFHHDPFFEFLDPKGVTRARGLALFFRTTIAAAAPRATITGARLPDGRLGGVSVVIPPGGYPLPLRRQVRELLGAGRAMILRPAGLVQGARYLFAIEGAHMKDPHWYLLLLVVDPSVQRCGIGGRLQRDMLARADTDGLECYLETQKEENVAYYRRFGYELDQELRPVTAGPALYTMRRAPHTEQR